MTMADVTPVDRPRHCASCGEPATAVITADLYGSVDGPPVAGRLMTYCDECRGSRIDRILTSLPLAMVDQDPEGVLLWMYEKGLTKSDPGMVRSLFFPELTDEWVKAATRLMSETR
jgi:hypothetical protein